MVCIYDLFRYQQLIKENLGEIAKLITVEQGKTLPDAEGDVMRGLQVERCRYLLVRIQIRIRNLDLQGSVLRMPHYFGRSNKKNVFHFVTFVKQVYGIYWSGSRSGYGFGSPRFSA